MSYSNLVTYVKISPHKNPRKNATYNPSGKVTDIAIHHMAGNASVETCGNIFADPARKGSSNYGISSDGRRACYVPEDYRSWCTSSRDVDYRAIAIEVANCSGDPDWKVSDAALKSLIELCVDICRRHGFTLNYTGGKDGNLHKHEWYAPTICPGPYLGGKFSYIAKEVNRRLKGTDTVETADVIHRVQVGAYQDEENAKRQLAKCKALGYDDAFIVTHKDIHRVQIGAFSKKENAERLCEEVKALGIDAFVLDVNKVDAEVEVTVEEYKPTVLEWQKAAMADGFKPPKYFPKYGADGVWGAECEAVAREAVVMQRDTYMYKNLTKLVQRAVGLTGDDVDGLCGDRTAGAIEAYQERHNIEPADGKAGIITMKEILL